jgi:hypothetical protein
MHQLSPNSLDVLGIEPILTLLRMTLKNQNGVVGFAPGILADADDTAKTLLTLQLSGEAPDITPMVGNFRSKSGFKTFELERNPSFSANCNVLLALGLSDDVNCHISEIQRVTEYLVSSWKTGNFSDKWNISPRYSIMLLSSAFIQLLRRYDDGDLTDLSENLVQKEIPLCLCQVTAHTIRDQNEDGSWESSLEATAYSVLTISHILKLPFHETVSRYPLMRLVFKAQDFLSKHLSVGQKNDHDYLWIEKVAYGSTLLRKTYSITAIHTSLEQASWTPKMARLFQLSMAASKTDQLFNKIPYIKESPQLLRNIALLESMHWSKSLHESKYTIFSKGTMQPGDDKYFHFIPLIWTTCNTIGNSVLSSDVMWDMILLSLLVYQVDEFMESIVANMSESTIHEIKKHINADLMLNFECNTHSGAHESNLSEIGVHSPSYTEVTNGGCSQEIVVGFMPDAVVLVLKNFARHILRHPKVTRASQALKKDLSDKICSFILAHLAHICDNHQLKAARNHQGTLSDTQNPRSCGDYYKWVHATGAEDTSCPLSYIFFLCLISEKPGKSCLRSPLAQYTNQSVMRHLATMCRQYNDYGSAVRDMEEGNLNSLDFLGFWQGDGPTLSYTNADIRQTQYPIQRWKDELLEVAGFERKCMELSLRHLEEADVPQLTIRQLEVFIKVTDLFGQLYVYKDLTNRVRK